MKGDVIISYDNSKEVRDAFSGRGWKIHKVETNYGTKHNTKQKELLITNFNPSKERAKAKPFDESKAKKEIAT